MGFLTRLWRRCVNVCRPDRGEAELARELASHVSMLEEQYRRQGLDAAAAGRAARLALGGIEQTKEHHRRTRSIGWLHDLRRDVLFAMRGLLRTPLFTIASLLTLGICLGANIAVFTVVDAVIVRPLPFPSPDRLVTLFNTYPRAQVLRDESSITNYYDRRGRIAAFGSLSIYRYGSVFTGEAGAVQHEPVTFVSPEFFQTLGTPLALGRAFTDADMTFQTNAVAILTDAYWRERFGGDPHVLGRVFRVDGNTKMIVGVLPPGFRFLSSDARFYLPFASNLDARQPRQRHSGSAADMIARLRPGVTLEEAQEQIDAENTALEQSGDDPAAHAMKDAGFRTMVVPLRQDHVASARSFLLLIQLAALVLFLVGAVNLMNLFFIRATGRVKEMAVKQALGSSRRRLAWETLVEVGVLAGVGTVIGLGVGAAGARLFHAFGADRLPLAADIVMNARIVAAACVAAVLTTVAIGVPVARFNAGRRLDGILHAESRTSTASHAVRRLRHVFLVAQMTLAFVLLASAGVLGLSLAHALAVSPGFQPDRLLTGRISLPSASYPTQASGVAFVNALAASTHRDDVVAAGIVTNLPLSGNTTKSAVTVKDYQPAPGESPHGHYWYGVAGAYFTALGIPLRQGRLLDAADETSGAHVCDVDEDFARRYWPNGRAIGQQLFQGSTRGKDADAFTVVGVVGAVTQDGEPSSEHQGAVYFPYSRLSDSNVFLVVRTSPEAPATAATLRHLVQDLDPALPIDDVRTMEARVADSQVGERSPAMLAGIFAAVALLLTGLGTYGAFSYAVGQQRREIGVRMALGAAPSRIRRHFLFVGFRLFACGALLGVAGTALALRAMRTLLVGVAGPQTLLLAGTAVALGAVVFVACLLPSRAAARMRPLSALADN